MRTKYSKKLFPFAPGIPWTIKNYKYVVPEIDKKIWDRILCDKDFIITCYGGFLESLFSLSYCEAIAKTEPHRTLKWMGNSDFEKIVAMQGLARVNEFNLTQNIIDNYPVPIFMDKENNAYFNVLNNYITTKSYIPNKRVLINKNIILKQIYQNCMLPWDNYTPKLRNFDNTKYNAWKKNNRFHDNSKYILIFPKAWSSVHDISCLGWDNRQILELAEMVRHLGIKIVSCDSGVSEFYRAGQLIHAPMDFEIAIGLLMNCNGVLSESVDYLFAAMMLSKSVIMSRLVDGIYDLFENAEFIGSPNVIFTDRELTPVDVYKYLESAF